MSSWASIIAARALSSARRVHPATYVGLRILLEDIPVSKRAPWIDGYTRRQGIARREHSYWTHPVYKGPGEASACEYRVCLVGSPTTVIHEAWLLERLARERAFAVPPCVYSYRWPRSKFSRSNFAYYLTDYYMRHDRIQAALHGCPDGKVLVTDIHGFYPSVDKESVRQRFRRRMDATTLSVQERDGAEHSISDMLSERTIPGLPIGPDPAHVLGNLALEAADRELSGRYPRHFFRYVDDIAVVLPANEVEAGIRMIGDTVKSAGFYPNLAKTGVLTDGEWREHAPCSSKNSLSVRYRDLLRRIQMYFAARPRDYRVARSALTEAGFTLPLTRLHAVTETAAYSRWFHTRANVIEKGRAFVFDNITQLLAAASSLRQDYWSEVASFRNRGIDASPIIRRWQLQRLRHLLTVLLALSSPEQWLELLQISSEYPELRDVAAIISGLATGDVSELLEFPGRAIWMFSQLALDSGISALTACSPWALSPVSAESLTVLTLHGLCPLVGDAQWQDSGKNDYPLFNACTNDGSLGLTPADFGYVDEFQSLRIGVSQDRIARTLRSRLRDDEDCFFDESDPCAYLY